MSAFFLPVLGVTAAITDVPRRLKMLEPAYHVAVFDALTLLQIGVTMSRKKYRFSLINIEILVCLEGS
jgi:hypothetical protein